MDISKKIRFSTENDSTGGLTYCLRSLSTTIPNVCSAAIIQNCRVDMNGNANPFIFEVGNIVYNNFSGSTLFNGNNLYYVVVTSIAPETEDTYLCRINTIGVMTEVNTYVCPIEP